MDKTGMKIAVMTLYLRASWVHSLKEKRMIVKSLIAKLQNRYHVSAAEVDEQDTHQIMKKFILLLFCCLIFAMPVYAITYDSATDTWMNDEGNPIDEEDLPPDDLSEYSHSFYVHETFTAGDVVLEVNTVTIGGAEYVLRPVSINAWDETYNQSGMADYRSGQDKFLESYCLLEKDMSGAAVDLPKLYDNTPMELIMTLTDRTNEVSSKVTVRINEADKLMRVSDGEHTIIFMLNDSSAAESLYAQLPMTIPVEDYGSNEKIFYPDQELDVSSVTEESGGAGGLAYFSPWGNVVMYYDAFGEYPGLYLLGEAMDGAEEIGDLSGTVTVEAQ